VRAGSRGREIRSFLDDGFVGLGWKETGSLEGVTDFRAFEERLLAVHPTRSSRTLTAWAAMLRAVVSGMDVGDDVMTIESSTRHYWIGKVTSEYQWHPDADLAHRRAVRWSGSLSRAHLTETTRNCLGAISTVFRLSVDATAEVLTAFRTLGAPSVPGPPKQRTPNAR
jgi:restriction system protein